MRVSVVIPSYNHGRYIGQAIRSVAAQTHPDVEIVVVDDGSTDDSVARIRRALDASDVSRTLLHEQANSGAPAAIDRGVSLSTGECVAILNSDDFYLPERLATACAHAAGRSNFLVFSRLGLVDDDSQPLPPGHAYVKWYEGTLRDAAAAPTLGFALLMSNCFVTSGNLVFSRELYDAVGSFSEHRFCHDWDFVMRATRHVEPEMLDEVLMCYRVHEDNSSHALRGVQEQEAGDALNRFLDECREGGTPNPIAPCPHNWERFFELFSSRHSFHFDTASIRHYIDPRNRARPGA